MPSPPCNKLSPFIINFRRPVHRTEKRILREKSLSKGFFSIIINLPAKVHEKSNFLSKKVISYQEHDFCTYNLVSKLCINDRFYKQYGALAFPGSKLYINYRFYKRSGALAFACSKLFINDRFYKQYGALALACPKLCIHNKFHKQFWHLAK